MPREPVHNSHNELILSDQQSKNRGKGLGLLLGLRLQLENEAVPLRHKEHTNGTHETEGGLNAGDLMESRTQCQA